MTQRLLIRFIHLRNALVRLVRRRFSGRMQKVLHWQCFFEPAGYRGWMMDGLGWHTFTFGIIRIHTVPADGEALGRRNYHGFIIRFAYWFPIDRA